MTTTPAVQQRSASKTILVLLLILAVAGVAIWYSGIFKPRPKLALVTANEGPFWDMLVRGAQDSAAKHDVELQVFTAKDESTQTAIIQSLADQKFDGVAISPNNAGSQASLLLDIGSKTNLITYDSDCPISTRLCFIGTDDYDAGQTAAQYVRKAIPDGGEVLISVGSIEKENGQRRRQGLIDGLLDRQSDPTRAPDSVDAPLKGAKYTVDATLVDGLVPAKATSMVADAIDKHPNTKCIVGLFAYSTPAILKGLEQKKTGQIQVIGFDFNDETLAGIDGGHVSATMVQDAYLIGNETIRLLSDVARGDKSQLPMFQIMRFSCDPVTKDNIAALRQKLPHGQVASTMPAPH